MTIFKQDFEAGTVGSSAATGSTGAGNNAIAAIGTAPVITSTSGEVISGTKSAKCSAAAGAASAVNMPVTMTTDGGFYVEYTITAEQMASTADELLVTVRSSAGVRSSFLLRGSDKKISVGNAAGGYVWTTPSAISAAGTYVFESLISTGTTTTDGKVKVWITKKADGTFAAGMTAGVETVGQNMGAGQSLSNFYAGAISTTNTPARAPIVDNMYATDSYTRTGPVAAPANTAPTVSPGSAQTVTAATASLSGTATDTGSLVSATWALQSTTATSAPSVSATSSTGAGSSNMTATASVTGLTAGTHVFRLTASDGSLTGYGDVTIYVPAATVGPNRVISNAGAWVAVNAASLVAAVDKTADDDSSYIETPASPSGAEITFGVDPVSAGDETVPFRARYTGTGTFTCTPSLYSGTTLITTAAAPITLTNAFANYSVALTSGENAAISNRNDVRVRLVATQS